MQSFFTTRKLFHFGSVLIVTKSTMRAATDALGQNEKEKAVAQVQIYIEKSQSLGQRLLQALKLSRLCRIMSVVAFLFVPGALIGELLVTFVRGVKLF